MFESHDVYCHSIGRVTYLNTYLPRYQSGQIFELIRSLIIIRTLTDDVPTWDMAPSYQQLASTGTTGV